MLSYDWPEEKRNRSQVYRIAGPSPLDDSLSGMWLIQVWQSENDWLWYADIEFENEGQTQAFQVEQYGPGHSKTEAVELAREGLETFWLNPPASTLF